MYNGILVFNKPAGFTSHDVVAKLRGITHQKKIGHGGTLDPMATGVLPVLFGNATKASDYAMSSKKQYLAAMRLGTVTDTQDITGTILSKKNVNVTEQDLFDAINKHIGEIYQIPPMYSAVHKDGKRLYDLARSGIEVEREKRKIFIHDITYQGKNADGDYLLSITCSKGTYIRTLCCDIGDYLGCGATVTMLQRTLTCGFGIDMAADFDTVKQYVENGRFDELLIPTEKIFCRFPAIVLNSRLSALVKNGVRIRKNQLDNPVIEDAEYYRVFDNENNFMLLGKFICDENGQALLASEKNFAKE